MAEIIVPQKPVEVVFSLEPAHNAITSLSLLDMAGDFSGLSDWVYRIEKTLTTEEQRTNQLVLQDINVHLADESWPSFPAWLDELEAQEASDMRDRALAWWLEGTAKAVGGGLPGGAGLPATAELLADRSLYLSLAKEAAGADFDRGFWQEMHRLLNDPLARQELIVSHLRAMWDRFLAAEWQRTVPMLEESIMAFESLDLTGLTAHEALRRVVLRAQIPEGPSWLSEVEKLIFIPSIHCGPYLIRLGGLDSSVARFAYGARIPEGASTPAPALNRSELLMRLNALANDTRLSILELLAKKGELGTPDVVQQLALSQSAAARHLEHLTATGYLTTRRRQGTNLYRLNPDQIDQTFNVLKELCR